MLAWPWVSLTTIPPPTFRSVTYWLRPCLRRSECHQAPLTARLLAAPVSLVFLMQVRALTIALAFHQFLEGVALGAFVMHTGFSWLKQLAMVVMYSLACPVGVAIGLGITNTYDSSSVRARAVEGVFNGVSGGMLLYLAFALIWTELQRMDQMRYVRLTCFAAMCLGSACFAVLAIWA